MTIEEKVEKVYPVFIGAGLGCTVDYNERSREAYIKGAYDALEEIEKLLPESGWLSVGDGIRIREKIKELKSK